MSDEELTRSKSDGPHRQLARLVGGWEGTVRTWFEPGKLADESPISGTFRSVLDGRFVIHEYAGELQGKELAGLAVHGYELQPGRFTTAWIDSFHTGTAIMLSEGDREPSADGFSVLGSYEAGSGPRWGWRTELEFPEADRVVITHYNITPVGEEAKAVEIQYRRKA